MGHHKAIGSIGGANGVTSKADWGAVNAALGRVIASVPESTVMDVYNSVSSVTDPGVPAYLKSLVNGRLQCLCRVGEPSRSEQTVFDRECIGRKCGGQGFLRVQGCSQGCAAVRRARRSCMLLML